MQTMLRIGPNFIALDRYRRERNREIVKAVAAVVIISFVLFVLIWVTP